MVRCGFENLTLKNPLSPFINYGVIVFLDEYDSVWRRGNGDVVMPSPKAVQLVNFSPTSIFKWQHPGAIKNLPATWRAFWKFVISFLLFQSGLNFEVL